MRQLTDLISQCGGQRAAARATGISATLINMLCRGTRRPGRDWPREKLLAWLTGLGISASEAEQAISAAVDHARPKGARPKASANAPLEPATTPATTANMEDEMILRKQTLTRQARQQWRILREPFADPQEPDDLYLSPEARYVRECMYDAATNGGFLAVVGESGSGKTTLREDMIERINLDGEGVVVIEPYMLGMGGGRTGRTLRARDIAEAVIATVSPTTTIPASAEIRARKLHQLLRDSNRAGIKHVLVIEEAHDLHPSTLKALKRFWELKDGLKRLLAIILLGQTELLARLGANQADVREVVQRCVPVQLPAIADPAAFVRHRFERAGLDVDAVWDADALAALRERLMVAQDMQGRGVYMGYPLAISNLATAAMNMAASLGEPRVSADVVRQVRA